MQYYLEAFKRFSDFSGRSSRAAYWYFVLFNFIVSFILGFLDGMLFRDSVAENGFGLLTGLYLLVLLVPSLALTVRRLHDIGKSGWWLLIVLIPFIGGIVLLVYYLRKGDAGPNAYGPNPEVARTDMSPQPQSEQSQPSNLQESVLDAHSSQPPNQTE